MAKQGGMGDLYVVDGDDISGDIGSLGNVHGGPAPSIITDITQSAESRIGLRRDGGLSAAVWFDPAVAHPVLKALPYTSVRASYGIGRAIGAPMASCIAKQINYDGTPGADGSFTLAVDWQASDGTGLEWGEQLTAGKRTDTAATNGTALNGVVTSTTFGASAYLHVYSVAGTSVTVSIEDSADNVSFAAVTGLAFTAVLAGAKSGQYLSTSTTATIRRYVRAVTTGTFSSAVFTVNFVRYLTAQS
jgi:hypothetical protein